MFLKQDLPKHIEGMAAVENLNKTLYKVIILYLKIIPILLGIFDFSNTLLSYYNIDMPVISYIAGISFLPLSFIYLASYVFKFCEYHRMPLHYIVVTNFINIYDMYVGVPLSDRGILSLYLIVAFISIIITIILYVKSNKKYSRKDNK